MRKFFIILGVLFLIVFTVTILTGNLSWKSTKNAGVIVTRSLLQIPQKISETISRINKPIQKKIRETREYWKKRRGHDKI